MMWNGRGALIHIELEQMSRYLDITQEALASKQREFNSFVEATMNDIGPDDVDWYVDQQSDEYWELHKVLPGYLYSSFVVSWYSYVEHELFALCSRLTKEKALQLQHGEVRGQGTQRARLYLSKVASIPTVKEHWNELAMIGLIRNSIVHNGGQLKDIPTKLRSYLDDHQLVPQDGLDSVTPTIEYCRQLINFGRTLFQNIFYDAGWTAERTSFLYKRKGTRARRQ